MRKTIKLAPNEKKSVDLIISISEDREKAKEHLTKYKNIENVKRTFEISKANSEAESRYLQIKGKQINLFEKILSYIIFENPLKKNFIKDTTKVYNREDFWKYGISGDLPIILVYVDKIEDAGIVNEVINFMDYVKNRKVDLDIVILINENEEINGPVYTYIKTRLDRAVYMDYSNGGIYLLNIKTLTKQEITLLSFLSKRYIQDVNELMCVVKENDDESIKLVETKEKNDVKEEGINEK